MSVRLETLPESDLVVVEFDHRIDAESLAECAERFDRIPRIWWKHVSVVLRGVDAIDSDALALLRYMAERASGCSLQLVECRPKVASDLQAGALLRRFGLAGGLPNGPFTEAT
jgi:anti-anti-sigma regulatory factor